MSVHLLDRKEELRTFLSSNYPKRNFLYVVDSKVKLFHADIAYDSDLAPMFAGERSKSIIGAMDIQNLIINSDLNDPVMVVIGGGTVLDACGFAISTYKTKIESVFIPTTLSAQLEGFFRNEVYLNFDRMKDAMRVNFQPDKVVNILEFVKTQTVEERKLAMIHAISFGLSHSKKFFDSLSKILDSNLISNDEVIKHVIFEILRMKANVGEKNVGEESAKALITASQLNIPYLNAMYYGVMIESFVSNKLGFLSDGEMEEIYVTLKECSKIHLDLSEAVDQLSNYEDPLKMKLPVKIGKTIDYQIFSGFLTEMIYSAQSKGLI